METLLSVFLKSPSGPTFLSKPSTHDPPSNDDLACVHRNNDTQRHCCGHDSLLDPIDGWARVGFRFHSALLALLGTLGFSAFPQILPPKSDPLEAGSIASSCHSLRHATIARKADRLRPARFQARRCACKHSHSPQSRHPAHLRERLKSDRPRRPPRTRTHRLRFHK